MSELANVHKDALATVGDDMTKAREDAKEYNEAKFEKWYKIDLKFWKDYQNGLIKIPENLKREPDKKSDIFCIICNYYLGIYILR